ncbi:hypothetical protein MUK72_16755 (plasmid) [Halococcus dombrowskii]|uniref:Uncharacterized protein n=1 Tax=Halococcus dombrowskii TaxID=179637 RepID=A0AAV3SM57_HALDO|nr:hypothetical protein [Halococcus dombrowskii]UOO97080.1 hypothetical protein MUK72_16755 [Halococcus dombrowskii]
MFGEIGDGIEHAAETLARVGQCEPSVLVEIAAGPLGVLDDVRASAITSWGPSAANRTGVPVSAASPSSASVGKPSAAE